MKPSHSVILLTGSNHPQKEAMLALAKRLIGEQVGRITAASQVCYSQAWGFACSSLFANQALEVESGLGPYEVLEKILDIEQQVGRDRESEQQEKALTAERYASRVIDIDLMLYDQQIIRSERLSVPHPLMQEREFALKPMQQIAPQRLHPALNRSIEELYNEKKKL